MHRSRPDGALPPLHRGVMGQVAHPPPMAMEKQGPLPVTAVPAGYPTTTVDGDDVPTHTRSKGDGFWKGW
ncbi:hypothetical protein R6Q59_022347 [Mikania micrantha]